MEEQTTNFIKDLQSKSPAAVISNPQVKSRFIDVYNSVWGEGGEAVYERESMYFNRAFHSKPDLNKCTGLSTFFAFIDLAVKGLSLEPNAQATCYLVPRSEKVGVTPNGQNLYEKSCKLVISGYGELVLRMKAGQVLHADNPKIVYEGDAFQYGEKDGRTTVSHMVSLPRTSSHIVACYIKIMRTDGTIDYSVMTEPEWKRLQGYSAKYNYGGKANQLYTSNSGQIDIGFLVAKCVRHAFKTYPRLKIGKGSALESDSDQQMMPKEIEDPYGLNGEQEQQEQEQSPKEPESFAPAQDTSAGVQITPTDDDDIF